MAKFKFKEEGETGDNIWHGQDLITADVPVNNDGSGKPIVMRVFEFQLPPLKPEEMPTNEQLIEANKTKVTAFLWRDELVPVMDYRCVIDKDGRGFKIFATCQAKAGSAILETPELLSTHLNANKSSTD